MLGRRRGLACRRGPQGRVAETTLDKFDPVLKGAIPRAGEHREDEDRYICVVIIRLVFQKAMS